MSARNDYKHGTFCWVDLMTPDPEGAKAFYGELFGWTHDDQPTDMGPPYTLFKLGSMRVAGMSALPPDMQKAGMPPVWNSYIRVTNADDVAAKVVALGGKVRMPVMQVMNEGRMAFLADREGASFGIWEPNEHRGADLVNEPGAFCWNELYTRDLDTAKAFYGDLFGWTFETSPGATGPYTSFKNGDTDNGGMLPITAEMGDMPPNWGVYLAVADHDVSSLRAKELGGRIVTDAMDVPDVGRFSVLTDPAGASFVIIELDRPA